MSQVTNSLVSAEGKNHPLQNILILEKVFGFHQTAKAVLRNRLVCKVWLDTVQFQWQQLSKFPVLCYHPQSASKITGQKLLMDLNEFYNRCVDGDTMITRFLTTPPCSMELHAWELFSGDRSVHELDIWFWSLTITPRLTKLTLSNCDFIQAIRIYQKCFLEKLPNLETLAIKNGIVRSGNKVSVTRKEQMLPRRRFMHSSLRNLEISLTFTRPMETPDEHKFYLWFEQFPKLTKLKIALSDFPPELPKILVNTLVRENKAKCLVGFDLLDFSKEAHKIGCDVSFCHNFPNLQYAAIDLGITPKRYYGMLNIGRIRKLVLYRAPFEENFPDGLNCWGGVYELELWGNVNLNMELQFLRDPYSLKKLVWNTRCYDSQYKGKRIQHLLNANQKTYPLVTYDLVGRTINLPNFEFMHHLDIDFGPLSDESWARLGQHAKGLLTLKAVFGKDHELRVVSQIWPNLMVLEIKHRSTVSLAALTEILPNMGKLWKFYWKGCACTSSFFTDVQLLREMENLAYARWKNNVELPWKLDGDKLVTEEVCLEAEFEKKLLVQSIDWQSK